MTDRGRVYAYGATVIALAVAAHGFAVQNGFVDFDDDDYVFLNPRVAQGLTLDGARWAFTTGHAANYHPLTWLSHMADVSAWGMNPMGHHLTNVVLHAVNSLLILVMLLRFSGATRESWTVALLFAVHPLHVESVAWVSERKDLLCAFFMLVSLAAYAGYVQNRRILNYACMFFAFVCALLSKPMAVTLPFVMLILDDWPLQRTVDLKLGDTLPMRIRSLVREKLPLFALSAVSCVITYLVQHRGGAMNPDYQMPLAARMGNAAISYLRYMGKLVWPFDLSPIYPLPIDGVRWWSAMLAGSVLIVLTFMTWRERRRAPYLWAGWSWYVVMLTPVIGIVQVGYASMADRYMYLPMTGILIAIVWTGADILRRCQTERITSAVFAFGFVLIAGLASLTQRQTAIWKNSESLFTHAIQATHDNAEAYAHLGLAYLRADKAAEAIAPLEEAVRIRPNLKEAHTSLGVAYRLTGQLEKAIAAHEESLRIDPNQAVAHANLGIAYAALGNYADAERHLREALRIDPNMTTAKETLAGLLDARGRSAEAATPQ